MLVRYTFPFKRIVDAWSTCRSRCRRRSPASRSTAVYAPNGWIGQCLAPLGIKVAFTPLGVLVALTFIGLPFVVRTVQPVLEDFERELEEAAASLGATRWQTFRRVILPSLLPALADRLRARVRARAGRIRLGDLHRGQRADEVRDHVAADHHQARTVRLRGRDGDRGRDAVRVLRDAAADQPAAVAARARAGALDRAGMADAARRRAGRAADAQPSGTPVARHCSPVRTPAVSLDADGDGARFPRAVPRRAAGGRVRAGVREGRRVLLRRAQATRTRGPRSS